MKGSFSLLSLATVAVSILFAHPAYGWLRRRDIKSNTESQNDVSSMYHAYKSGEMNLDDHDQNDDNNVTLLTQAVLQQLLDGRVIFDWAAEWSFDLRQFALDGPNVKHWAPYLWPRHLLPITAQNIPFEQFVLDGTGARLIHVQTDQDFLLSQPDERDIDAPKNRTIRSYILRSPLATDMLPLDNQLAPNKTPLYWPPDMPLIRANCWAWVYMTIANVVLTAHEKKSLVENSKKLDEEVVRAGQHIEETHPEAIIDLWKEAIGLDPDHVVVDIERPQDVPAGAILHLWSQKQVDEEVDLRRPHIYPEHTLLVMEPSLCLVDADIICAVDLDQNTDISLLQKHDTNAIDRVGSRVYTKEVLKKYSWTYQRVKKSLRRKLFELYGGPNEK